jgi:hypothetical protein
VAPEVEAGEARQRGDLSLWIGRAGDVGQTGLDDRLAGLW